MAKVIMVQGTMSGAGKSLIVAGLCRVFAREGYKVAPFKSQNMALNSYITDEGLEMGRAQVMQAEAAYQKPVVAMNPILLKPTDSIGSQVIVNGKAIGNMPAKEYFSYKKKLIPEIMKAYNQLDAEYDIIVIEGAGSPAEINLKENDIVNMGMAKLADAPVILVGDIDRGGVFAQLLGTLMLLEDDEKDRIKGLVINKFRGDKTILDPGIEMLEQRGGKKVVGVIPFADIRLEDEDSQTDKFLEQKKSLINIGVIHYPRISNFTDFDVFKSIDGVSVHFIKTPNQLADMDMIILPGSKNTMGDLLWMRENGLEASIKKLRGKIPIIGICGGYQMLGKKIEDPHNIEHGGSMRGMELLDFEVIMSDEKTTTQKEGKIGEITGFLKCIEGLEYRGYEIHHGQNVLIYQNDDDIIVEKEKNYDTKNDDMIIMSREKRVIEAEENDMAIMSGKDDVYGTYIHGIFDGEKIAYNIISELGRRKNIDMSEVSDIDYAKFKESQYDKLADIICEYMDMESIYDMMNES